MSKTAIRPKVILTEAQQKAEYDFNSPMFGRIAALKQAIVEQLKAKRTSSKQTIRIKLK